VRDRYASTTSAVAHWVRSYREDVPLFALAFDIRPLCREQAGGGVAFLLALPPSRWLLLLTPGILPFALRAGFAVRTRFCACVAKQREVIRVAAAVRKPAAGEPSAVSLQPETEALDPGLRRGDEH